MLAKTRTVCCPQVAISWQEHGNISPSLSYDSSAHPPSTSAAFLDCATPVIGGHTFYPRLSFFLFLFLVFFLAFWWVKVFFAFLLAFLGFWWFFFGHFRLLYHAMRYVA